MEQEICLLLTVTDICSSHIWDASCENKMAVKIVAKGWWKKACRDQTHKNWYISLIRNSDCSTYKPILNLGWRLNRVGYFELRNAWSTGSCRALCGYWWQRGSWSFICYFSVSVHLRYPKQYLSLLYFISYVPHSTHRHNYDDFDCGHSTTRVL